MPKWIYWLLICLGMLSIASAEWNMTDITWDWHDAYNNTDCTTITPTPNGTAWFNNAVTCWEGTEYKQLQDNSAATFSYQYVINPYGLGDLNWTAYINMSREVNLSSGSGPAIRVGGNGHEHGYFGVNSSQICLRDVNANLNCTTYSPGTDWHEYAMTYNQASNLLSLYLEDTETPVLTMTPAGTNPLGRAYLYVTGMQDGGFFNDATETANISVSDYRLANEIWSPSVLAVPAVPAQNVTINGILNTTYVQSRRDFTVTAYSNNTAGNITCDFYDLNIQNSYELNITNSTTSALQTTYYNYSSQPNADAGSYSLNVTCDDGVDTYGATANFTFQRFNITGFSSGTATNETASDNLTMTVEVADYDVDIAPAYLYWDFTSFPGAPANGTGDGASGSYNPTNTTQVCTSGNYCTEFEFAYNMTFPLIETNNTNITYLWYVSDLNASSTFWFDENHQNQTLYWSTYISSYSLNTPVLESETITFTNNLVNAYDLADILIYSLLDDTYYANTRSSSVLYTGTTSAPVISVNNVTLNSNSTLNLTFGGRTYNRTSSNETMEIYKALLGACGGNFTEVALNYTLWDEEDTSTRADGSTARYTFWVYPDAAHTVNNTYNATSAGISTYELCIFPSFATIYVDSFQEHFKDGEYPLRNYFLDNATVTNSSSNFNIYLLNETFAKLISLTLDDANGQPYTNAFIYFNRYYAEENSYKTVSMCQTDDNGQCTTYLFPNDIFHRIVVVRGGEVINTFTPQTISCDPAESICPLTLSLSQGSFANYFDYSDKIASSCSFNNATNVSSCTVTDTSGLVLSSTLKVEKKGLFTDTVACTSTLSTASGTHLCSLGNIEGDYISTLTARVGSNTETTLLQQDYISSPSTPVFKSTSNLFVLGFLGFAVVGIGLFNPAISILGGILLVLAGLFMGVLDVSVTGAVAVVIVGIALMLKMRS